MENILTFLQTYWYWILIGIAGLILLLKFLQNIFDFAAAQSGLGQKRNTLIFRKIRQFAAVAFAAYAIDISTTQHTDRFRMPRVSDKNYRIAAERILRSQIMQPFDQWTSGIRYPQIAFFCPLFQFRRHTVGAPDDHRCIRNIIKRSDKNHAALF